MRRRRATKDFVLWSVPGRRRRKIPQPASGDEISLDGRSQGTSRQGKAKRRTAWLGPRLNLGVSGERGIPGREGSVLIRHSTKSHREDWIGRVSVTIV